MTHPTKAIYKWLIQDSVRVGNTASSAEQPTQLYSEADHLSTFNQIQAIDYHTTHTVFGIRITPYPAGHVLGAAMYHLDIAGLSVLFTGDYSREEDRHLIPATFPRNIKVDVLITESTFGVSSHTPRKEREASLMRNITGVLDRGGRALLPVFALGHTQELLLILDEYWQAHPEYQRIPIYYASNLARKCMVVYQTYIGSMNDHIKCRFRERMAEVTSSGSSGGAAGPWDFRFIRSLKSLERFEDVGPSVMLASPGMMQNGVSRELLERWAPDARNGVIITGYSVEGTMAKSIMNEPDQIQAVMTKSAASGSAMVRRTNREPDTQMVPRRCSVAEFSFGAHVDGNENKDFIESVGAHHIILVHGEKHNMARLKSRLMSLNQGKAEKDKAKIYNPRNSEHLMIPISKDKVARVVGKLAERIRPEQTHHTAAHGDHLIRNAVLVQDDFKLSLMDRDPDDLREYAGLTITTVNCRHKLTLASASIELIRWALEGAFGGIEELPTRFPPTAHDKPPTNGNSELRPDSAHAADAEPYDEEIDRSETRLRVMDCVTVNHRPGGEILVEWEGNVMNDGFADAVVAVLLGVESSPAAVKQSSKLHGSHAHKHGVNGDVETPRNPHANIDSATQLSRLLMFIEAQFGAEAVEPLAPNNLPTPSPSPKPEGDTGESVLGELEKQLPPGVPPALRIKVDEHEAMVWLAEVVVECRNPPLKARVKAVVERAFETVAPLWRSSGR